MEILRTINEPSEHRRVDASPPCGTRPIRTGFRDRVAPEGDRGRALVSLPLDFSTPFHVLPQVAPRSHSIGVRQGLPSRPDPTGCVGTVGSETEVGKRPVNPSCGTCIPRSRRAHRHFSSLKSPVPYRMIRTRQAGSFHTGRSAQSPRRRKPVNSVTSVTAGPEPRIRADFDPQVHRFSHHVPSEAMDCGAPSSSRLVPQTFQHHAPRPPFERPRPAFHRLDRCCGTWRERIAHRVGCGGATRSGWKLRMRPLDGPLYG